MALLVMMRHGQSKWNEANLFTGWVDVPLSQKGINEAIQGGKEIAHIAFDVIYVSALIRAQSTGMLAMSQNHSKKIPVILHPGEGKMDEWGKIDSEGTVGETIPTHIAWQLNERMYGALQGHNKDDMRAKYGKEQVHIWRRSFDVAPPKGESLKMTAERSIPYFNERIVPHLKKGENVFIAAHGNSLRSIVMELDGLSTEEVLKLEIPTGVPLTYEYKDGVFHKR